jgi:hypothetical protein
LRPGRAGAGPGAVAALAAVLLAAALAAAYAPVWTQPYLFLDDNYVVRGHDPEDVHPNIYGLHGVIQGRPVIAALFGLTRLATAAGGPDAMAWVRLAGAVGVAAFGALLWMRLSGALGSRVAAFAAALAIASLPSFQVVVAAGPWLAAGLLLAGAAFLAAERALEASAGPPRRRAGWMAGAVCLLGLSLGVYQATAQAYVALVLLGFLFADRPASAPALRRCAAHAAVWAGTVAAYWAAWSVVYRIAFPSLAEGRYSPGNVTADLGGKLAWYLDVRLPQVLNLWDVEAGGDRLALAGAAALAVIAAGLAAEVVRRLRAEGPAGLAQPAVRAAGAVAALVAADAAALAARETFATYTTALPVALAAGFVLLRAAYELVRPPAARAALLSAVALAGLASAHVQVRDRFASPLSREADLVADALLSVPAGAVADPVVVRVADRPPGDRAFGEYAWNNLNHEFYVHWFVRNQLWRLGLDQAGPAVVAIGRDGVRMPPMTLGPPGDGAVRVEVVVGPRQAPGGTAAQPSP